MHSSQFGKSSCDGSIKGLSPFLETNSPPKKGIKYYSGGFPVRFYKETVPNLHSSVQFLLQGSNKAGSLARGGGHTIEERGDRRNHRLLPGILQSSLSRSKERKQVETDYRLVYFKPSSKEENLQDGNNLNSSFLSCKRGMDDKHRLDRCVLPYSNFPPTSEVFEVYDRNSNLSILRSSFWSNSQPRGLHSCAKTSSSLVSPQQFFRPPIHRRLVNKSSFFRKGGESYRVDSNMVTRPGVQGELRQVRPCTRSDQDFPWCYYQSSRFLCPSIPNAPGQFTKSSQRSFKGKPLNSSQMASSSRTSDFLSGFNTIRNCESSSISTLPSTTMESRCGLSLPESTSHLRVCTSPGVVARPTPKQVGSLTNSIQCQNGDVHRCLGFGMGCSYESEDCLRGLECFRDVCSHKSKRDVGCSTGLSCSLQKSCGHRFDGGIRQHYSGSLSEQGRRNDVLLNFPGGRRNSLHLSPTKDSASSSLSSGVLNLGADMLSRTADPVQSEWTLSPAVVNFLWDRYGKPEIDLFATCLNNRLPRYMPLVQTRKL